MLPLRPNANAQRAETRRGDDADDDDDLSRLRERRMTEMRKAQGRREELARRGHGEYREILDEKAFFAEMKNTERMVCHFFRNNWPCKVRRLRAPRPRVDLAQGARARPARAVRCAPPGR